MGFLFPLFLIAGLALAIPVIIHLFNLRRYKKVYFPDNRFLKDIFLSTRQQSKIRNWRLLLSRLFFLAALLLAFSQPFFKKNKSSGKATVSAVYIDNSYSMLLAEGQQNLLQQSIAKIKALISAASDDSKFLILTNDHPSATRPMMRLEALKYIDDIKPTAKTTSLKQIVQSIAAAQDNEKNEQWNFYLFSDLQKGAFITNDKIDVPKNVNFYLYPMQEKSVGNIYVDTAYFLTPTLDTRQPNQLVVSVKKSGGEDNKESNLNVLVDNQVRAVSAIHFTNDTSWTDTLTLQLNGKGWQDIAISLQDHPLSFDDTFRIAARTSPNLSILVLNEGLPNTFLQTALGAQQGFQLKQESVNAVNADEWKQYSLVILQNVNTLSQPLVEALKSALERGQNILLFPGGSLNPGVFNPAMKNIADINFGNADTATQQIVSIQNAHQLLQDMFEKVPENVQLPVTAKRYPMDAGLTANQQSLMSFKDGRPFLAQYSVMQGKLYICASPLDDKSSNFPLSYYFVPILYKMAVQAGGNNILAMNIGSDGSVWLPEKATDSREVWKIVKNNVDVIPPQRPSGTGIAIYAGKSVQEAGFYQLMNDAAADTAVIAFNTNRTESRLDYASQNEITQLLKPAKINWLNNNTIAEYGWEKAKSPFPVWKVCILLALAGLAIETWLLISKTSSKNIDKESTLTTA